MSLAPGTRIGPYEVISMVGAGGMGEVYRARDTKLARAVAIKILPDSFANDPERLARFEREARTLASLNHPNIAQIHGFEESDGIKALVMELVEGLTVADRLAQGPIPLDEALPVAKQIAEALAAAHEQGIIHRDLKPANIKVRPDGTVKVLDFGLAKALESVAASSSNSQSPTITSPAMMTHIGVILGTAAYMAPEQAKGRAADRRSDMWAFGCVLYEMLTVGGRSRATMSPTRLRRCCEVSRSGRRFLARRRQRFGGCYVTVWQKIRTHASGMRGPARIEITDAQSEPEAVGQVVPDDRRWRLHLLWAAGLALVILTAGGALIWITRLASVPSRPVARFTIMLPTGQLFSSPGHSPVVLSPGGTAIVCAANLQLHVRPLDHLESARLRGTEGGGRSPFFSPDGSRSAFGRAIVENSVDLWRHTSRAVFGEKSVGRGLNGEHDSLWTGSVHNRTAISLIVSVRLPSGDGHREVAAAGEDGEGKAGAGKAGAERQVSAGLRRDGPSRPSAGES